VFGMTALAEIVQLPVPVVALPTAVLVQVLFV
jgi:hypothetical protein